MHSRVDIPPSHQSELFQCQQNRENVTCLVQRLRCSGWVFFMHITRMMICAQMFTVL